MENNMFRNLFKFILMFLLIVIAFKFFIFLLPVILVGMLIYLVYNAFFRGKKYDSSHHATEKFVDSKKVCEAEVVREKKQED